MSRSRAPTLVSPSRAVRGRRLAFELKAAIELHQLTLEVENRAPQTRYFYRLVCERFCEYLRAEGHPRDAARLDLADLTLDHARGFVVWIKSAHSSNRLTGNATTRGPKTILEHVRALKAFSAFCVREGLLGADPLTGLRAPRVPIKLIPTFTPSHLQALLMVIERHPLRNRNQALLYLLLATGLRASELCGIKLGDVDLKGRRIKVLGKGSKERWVYFDPQTGKQLMRYMAERETESPYLFLSRNGARLNRNALFQLLKDLGREAGIAEEVRCSPHTFRHTFAVQFLESHPGALFHLQELLGHSDLEMTRRYAKIARGHERLEGPSVIESLGLDKGPRRR